VVTPGAHDLDIVGSGTILKATDQFNGRAILVIDAARNVRLRDFTLDGNRIGLEKQMDAPPVDASLRDYFPNSGVLLDRVQGAEVSNLTLANFPNLAIVASRAFKVRMHHLHVEDNGSLDQRRHNNGSGGIAFEDGTVEFEVRSSTFRRLRGNALWTRSVPGAPRQENGIFAANRFDAIGHTAVLIGNASKMRVEENTGASIGYPAEAVDPQTPPSALAATGNVDHSTYAKNQFEEVNGRCINLDGFHDGIVIRNQCADRRLPSEYPFGDIGIVMSNTDPAVDPANVELTGNVIDGSKYGGLLLIGHGHRVMGNQFEHLNKALCDGKNCPEPKEDPKLLESGIYFGRGGARPSPARANTVRDNTISGYKMKTRCIGAAPGVSLQANTLAANACSDFDLSR